MSEAESEIKALEQKIEGLKALWERETRELKLRIEVLEKRIPVRPLMEEILEDIMRNRSRDYIEAYAERAANIRAVKRQIEELHEVEDRAIRILGIVEEIGGEEKNDN